MARSRKENKRYILLKLEDINPDDIALIAELRQTGIIPALYTEGHDVIVPESISLIKPFCFFTHSDKDKAYDMLITHYKLKSKDIIVPEDASEKSIRTERVKLMESLFDKALNGSASKDDMKILDKYLSSGFKGDFEADEKGMFPKSLKRGVLSEDGLYDLLEDI